MKAQEFHAMGNQPQALRRFRLRDIVEDRRIVLMLALGFSSGLPLLLVLGGQPPWLSW